MNNSKSVRVLYAEDDEDACYLVTMMLGFSNIHVTTTRTVAEAWQVGQNEDFDLCLLDSRFSDGSGLELCCRLRQHAPHKPIVFYSGDAYDTDKQNALAAGADAYLTKPYGEDLSETILQTIRLSSLKTV